MKIVIINYGAGNIQSIKFAIQRLGFEAVLTDNENEIRNADKVIPTLTQPVLGICLGMQLMCNHCEEGNIQGLNIFDVDVVKFDGSEKVPQIGWNQIENLKSDLFKGISEKEYMYLVHSFYVPLNDEAIATTEYGIKYASALQEKNFYGVQFHPEKSSKAGAKILENFLKLEVKY